ncbi:hypothetical protein SNE40_003550 [Patella caerulea]|uniref:Uncharacterized protein n=1 Tax=Patella caerulea TaxID=87958 RepID=A0AAN8K386_PATCE
MTTVLSTTTIATTTLAPEATTPATTTTTELTRSSNCFTYPHPSDPTKYLQTTVIGNITRNCAPGTQYVANICNCNFGFASRIKNKDCLPEVFISATSSIQSEGGYGPLWVDIKENVANQNGMAKFEGPDASIKIPRFNNVEYTDGLTITFRFQEQNKTPVHQVLVSNCVNPIGPSIEISINTDSNLATFSATIGDQGVKSEITIPYTPNEMKQIVMIHDGRAMTGFVGTARNTTTLRGYIQPRSVALHFGNSPCDSYQGFQGVMDDVSSYLVILICSWSAVH